MKVTIVGTEERTFKDKSNGNDVMYYRAYVYRPVKGINGNAIAEIKINKEQYKEITNYVVSKPVNCEVEFDMNGKLYDWVIVDE